MKTYTVYFGRGQVAQVQAASVLCKESKAARTMTLEFCDAQGETVAWFRDAIGFSTVPDDNGDYRLARGPFRG